MPHSGVSSDAIWMIVLDAPASESTAWHPPVYVTQGVMMCKPIVLSSGEWALPVCTWYSENSSKMVVSTDNGKTWSVRGGANMPREDRCFDEHMFVERKDGRSGVCRAPNPASARRSRPTVAQHGRRWSRRRSAPVGTLLHHAAASGNLLLVKHGPIERKTSFASHGLCVEGRWPGWRAADAR